MSQPSRERIRQLADKWLKGILTPQERSELDTWYEAEYGEALVLSSDDPNEEALQQRLYGQLQQKLFVRERKWPAGVTIFYYAAAALLIIGFGIFFIVRKPESPQDRKLTQHDILPGYNQATLTLADGHTISLDSAQSVIIVSNAGIKYNDGNNVQGVMLSEGSGRGTSGGETSLPTLLSLSTPKGGQYQIILPDGTKVWLNAASTLKYPSRFSGDKREVELEGEAYFSVDSRQSSVVSQKPFIVKSRGQDVKVLGTEFNISSYADEVSARTTLVTGAVQISTIRHAERSRSITQEGNDAIQLKPGEQSILNGYKLTKAQVDVDSELAWKNGYFQFSSEDIQSVMRKIARWYNVEVAYKGPLPTHKFGGSMSRFTNVSQVLRKLEMTEQVHFNIEGRKIIVTR